MKFDYSFLLPKNKLSGWFPMLDVYAHGDAVSVLADKSAYGNNLACGSTQPIYETNSINGRPSVKFDGSNNPLKSLNAMQVKSVFILAKSDTGTSFDSTNRGLISDSSMVDILTGQTSDTKFFDFSTGFNYRKAGVDYAENNQQAPFSSFELIEVVSPSVINLDFLQIGQQKDLTARKWNGRVAEIICFSSVITENERKAIALYFGCKFNLWIYNNGFQSFPTPEITGLPYQHFKESEIDWDKITVSHEYEDGGKDFNEKSDTAPREWLLEFKDLTPSQADIFERYWDKRRIAQPFSFTTKYGETFNNVRFKNKISRQHSGNKSWMVDVKVNLILYP